MILSFKTRIIKSGIRYRTSCKGMYPFAAFFIKKINLIYCFLKIRTVFVKDRNVKSTMKLITY